MTTLLHEWHLGIESHHIDGLAQKYIISYANILKIMQFYGKLPISASLNMLTVIMMMWLGLACERNMSYQEKIRCS